MKRWFVRMLGVALFALAAPAGAQFPGNAPVTLVMPYPPGGLGDYFVRLVAPKLSESLGVPVTVDNRAGANGAIGAAAVARAKPDGHTIIFVPASTVTTNPFLMKDVGYDPLKDFTPLALVLEVPNVLVVNPAVPAKTLRELIEARPQQARFGELRLGRRGIEHASAGGDVEARGRHGHRQHHLQGSGSCAAGPAGRSGADDVRQPAQCLTPHPGGQARALAVTGAGPSPALPDVPAVGSVVPGFDDMPWFAFLGPAGLPADVAAKLSEQLIRAVNSPDIVKALAARGGVIVSGSPDRLRALMKADADKVGKLIKEAGITVQ